MSGKESVLTPLKIRWSPLTVIRAALSVPMRILRTMSGSSPAIPPP
jgi:hypothetical protein